MFKRKFERVDKNFDRDKFIFPNRKDKLLRENNQTTSKNFYSVSKTRKIEKDFLTERNLNEKFLSEDLTNSILTNKQKHQGRARAPALGYEKNMNSAFKFHYMDDVDYDINCIDCYDSRTQSRLNHTNMRNNMIPINIEIEYSFSPKLLIKSVNTIIDNYEKVNESDSHGYSIKKEASSPNSARKILSINKENKNTHISKIFDSIFKSPNQEFDSGYRNNTEVTFNHPPQNNNCGVYNVNNHNHNYHSINQNIQPNRNHHHCSEYPNVYRNRLSNLENIPQDKYDRDNLHKITDINYNITNPTQNVNVNVTNFQVNKKYKEKIFRIEKIKTKQFDKENITLTDSEYQENIGLNNITNMENLDIINNFSKKINNDSGNYISIDNFNVNKIGNPLKNVEMVNKFNYNYSLLKCNLLQLSNPKIKSYLEMSISNLDDKDERFIGESYKQRYLRDYDDLENNLDKSKKRRSRSKYKMYSREEKEFCIDLIIKNNYNLLDVANCCEVPLKSLKRWLKVGCERKKGGGRKVKDPELDIKLINWYNDLIAKGVKPKYGMIKDKALKLTKSKNFMASKGWFEKFKKKYDLKFGRKFDTDN